MKKEELSSMDAKTLHKGMISQMVEMAKSWIREKTKEVKEFPVLPNGQRGLKIGCSIVTLPSHSCICRKVLTPDGKLILLDPKYVFYSDIDDKGYISEMTLRQIEREINRLRQ